MLQRKDAQRARASHVDGATVATINKVAKECFKEKVTFELREQAMWISEGSVLPSRVSMSGIV